MPAPKPPSARLFVAVFPSAEIAAAFASAQDSVHLSPQAARWTPKEQIHLTLNFIGHVPAVRSPEFAEAVAAATQATRPFTLEAFGLGVFPSANRARILWAGLRGDLDALHKLKDALDYRLQPLGNEPETRPFHPHLTLARVVRLKPADRRKLADSFKRESNHSFGAWKVEQIALMRSLLSPGGAKYSVEQTFNLVP